MYAATKNAETISPRLFDGATLLIAARLSMNASPMPNPAITVPARKKAKLDKVSPTWIKTSATISVTMPAKRAVQLVSLLIPI